MLSLIVILAPAVGCGRNKRTREGREGERFFSTNRNHKKRDPVSKNRHGITYVLPSIVTYVKDGQTGTARLTSGFLIIIMAQNSAGG